MNIILIPQELGDPKNKKECRNQANSNFFRKSRKLQLYILKAKEMQNLIKWCRVGKTLWQESESLCLGLFDTCSPEIKGN